jgi:transcriptional regulator with XRE-family HTH domain
MGERQLGTVGRNLRRLLDRENARRHARGEKPMSYVALAKAAGVTKSTVTNLILGYREDANNSTIRGFAQALGCTPNDLNNEHGAADPAWFLAFLEDPETAQLNLSREEEEHLLSLPPATWESIPPTSTTLRTIVLELRRKRLSQGHDRGSSSRAL